MYFLLPPRYVPGYTTPRGKYEGKEYYKNKHRDVAGYLFGILTSTWLEIYYSSNALAQ